MSAHLRMFPGRRATVEVYNTGFSTTTDADGNFRLKGVPRGNQVFITKRAGSWSVADYWYAPFETSQESADLVAAGWYFQTSILRLAWSMPRSWHLGAPSANLTGVAIRSSRGPSPPSGVLRVGDSHDSAIRGYKVTTSRRSNAVGEARQQDRQDDWRHDRVQLVEDDREARLHVRAAHGRP